jgi:dipeptidase E
VQQVVFVPFALGDWQAYTETARKRFRTMGYQLTGIHEHRDQLKTLQRAEAVFIGGGNTFRLLDQLCRNNLIPAIRQKVLRGSPYVGTSAGSNVAGVSIRTTNDMPIVYPPSFDALALVPFNINPHYIAPDPATTHMGETRDQRIKEFHELNEQPVAALREGSMLRVKDSSMTLVGTTDARVFLQNRRPADYRPGDDLSFLLKGQAGKSKR